MDLDRNAYSKVRHRASASFDDGKLFPSNQISRLNYKRKRGSAASSVNDRSLNEKELELMTRRETLSISFKELSIGQTFPIANATKSSFSSSSSSHSSSYISSIRSASGESSPKLEERFVEPNSDAKTNCRLSFAGLQNHPEITRLKQKSGVFHIIAICASLVPAVFMGIVLNLLDCMSYGILIFPPGNDYIPSNYKGIGISMFLTSTVISQLVYTFYTKLRGSNGSMMIEVMPFLHTMVRIISNKLEDVDRDRETAVFATCLAAYAIATILTGIVFALLGFFKLGKLVAFFPRHILIACIGGIGVFLIFTGFEVSTSVSLNESGSILAFIYAVSSRWRYVKVWGTALLLAVAHQLLSQKISSSLFTPLFFCTIPAIFYAVLLLANCSISDARDAGWFLAAPVQQGPSGGTTTLLVSWLAYFSHIHWNALLSCSSVLVALVFFSLLHVPINVPALAVSTKQAIHMDRELLAHGASNLLAGIVGTPQNYLVYTNTLLFIKTGGSGDSKAPWQAKFSGLLLALGTASLLLCGEAVLGYVPVIVIGSLIFLLGFDLIREGLFDTFSKVSRFEYLTIVTIVVVMTFAGFTEGIVAGIVLACASFVATYSRKSIVRSVSSGKELRSSVQRLYRQELFLSKCAHLISIIRLQGYLFFGSTSQLNNLIKLLFGPANELRYLVLDLTEVTGIDYSALESLERLKRLANERSVQFVLCGWSEIGHELLKVGLLDEENLDSSRIFDSSPIPYVSDMESQSSELECCTQITSEALAFSKLHTAVEWCENDLLKVYYKVLLAENSDVPETTASDSTLITSAHLNISNTSSALTKQLRFNSTIPEVQSPRSLLVIDAAVNTMSELAPLSTRLAEKDDNVAPIRLLKKAFRELLPLTESENRRLSHALGDVSAFENSSELPKIATNAFGRGNFFRSESEEHEFYAVFGSYFKRKAVSKGTILYPHGWKVAECYIIEDGVIQVFDKSNFNASRGHSFSSDADSSSSFSFASSFVTHLFRKKQTPEELQPLLLSSEQSEKAPNRKLSLFSANDDVRKPCPIQPYSEDATLVETLIPGTLFSLLDMVTRQHSNTFATVAQDAILWQFTQSDLEQCIEAYPKFALKFLLLGLVFDSQKYNQRRQAVSKYF